MTLVEQVRRAVAQARADWPITGVALCVVDRDGPLLQVDDGYADVASGRRVDEHTRFQIGSISKSFTAFVLGQLADEGRVDLEAPVTEYLPWFSVRSDFPPFTLRHLMQHTSGLITGGDALPDATAQAYALRYTQTGSAPGELFHYSNVGYALLGEVVAAVTGAPLGVALTERLLTPLGMHESSAEVTDADHGLIATGYEGLSSDRLLLPGDPLIAAPWLEVAAADGNIAATAADVGRYARMLLGHGRLDGVRVVSPAAFTRAISELAPGGEPSDYPSRYGLGLNVEDVDGHRWITHGGGMIGYACFLAVDLDTGDAGDAGLGVVVLTNAPGECLGVEQLARRVLTAVRTGTAPTDPRPRTALGPEHLGAFGDGERGFTVRAAGERTELVSDGESGTLYDTAQDRLGCDHPRWRRYPLRLVGTGAGRYWTYGPHVLRLNGGAGVDGRAEPDPPVIGRYRSYTPWYPSLSVVAREGRLHLVACAGVEAHTDEPELVELEPGVYRIGADPRLPERLVVGPVVDGRAIWVERDGCRYTRAFRQ